MDRNVQLTVSIERGNADVEREESTNGPLEFLGEQMGRIAGLISQGHMSGRVRDGNGNSVGEWLVRF